MIMRGLGLDNSPPVSKKKHTGTKRKHKANFMEPKETKQDQNFTSLAQGRIMFGSGGAPELESPTHPIYKTNAGSQIPPLPHDNKCSFPTLGWLDKGEAGLQIMDNDDIFSS